MKKKMTQFSLILVILLVIATMVLPVPWVQKAYGVPRNWVRDRMGAFTGPNAGTAQDDNVKASLDLAHTDLDAILADTIAIERSISIDLATIANGANNLFAVTGGPIKMTEFFIVVTGAIQAQSTLVGGNIDPTEPATDTVFGTDGTALEINGDAAGTVYSWDGVLATDFTATTNGVILAMGTDVSYGLLIPIGMIELTSSAASTGTMTVYMTYIPLSPDSVVTAQ